MVHFALGLLTSSYQHKKQHNTLVSLVPLTVLTPPDIYNCSNILTHYFILQLFLPQTVYIRSCGLLGLPGQLHMYWELLDDCIVYFSFLLKSFLYHMHASTFETSVVMSNLVSAQPTLPICFLHAFPLSWVSLTGSTTFHSSVLNIHFPLDSFPSFQCANLLRIHISFCSSVLQTCPVVLESFEKSSRLSLTKLYSNIQDPRPFLAACLLKF